MSAAGFVEPAPAKHFAPSTVDDPNGLGAQLRSLRRARPGEQTQRTFRGRIEVVRAHGDALLNGQRRRTVIEAEKLDMKSLTDGQRPIRSHDQYGSAYRMRFPMGGCDFRPDAEAGRLLQMMSARTGSSRRVHACAGYD